MPVDIKDVPVWATDERRIGHAVAYRNGAYVGTACDVFANFTIAETMPDRICRKCRERLKDAHLLPKAAA